MASSSARLLRRRFSSLLCSRRRPLLSIPHARHSFSPNRPLVPPITQGLAWHLEVAKGARGFQSQSKSLSRPDEGTADSQSCSNDSKTASAEMSSSFNKHSDVNFKACSNLKISSNHDLAMIFTCKVCETRSVKTVCRESYEKGVVVARCGGCNNLHLIADRLGWFGQPGSVEDFLAARGEEVKKGSADTLNLTVEDLGGVKSL